MKQVKKIFVMFGIIPIMFSCHSISDITGTYSMRNYSYEFVINADSTFHYSKRHGRKYSSGTWKRQDKNTIVLESDIQSNIIPLKIEVTPSDNKDPVINVKLIVPGKDEKEYRATPQFALAGNYYFDLFLPDRGSHSYEDPSYYSNEHELFFRVSKEPRRLEELGTLPPKEYYSLNTERKKVTLNDGDIVNVTITVPDSLFLYRVFNSEKIKVDGKTMIFRDKENNNKKNKLKIKRQ
jgi:hypothetical protein